MVMFSFCLTTKDFLFSDGVGAPLVSEPIIYLGSNAASVTYQVCDL